MNLKVYDTKDFPTYLPKLNALYDDLFSGGKGFRSKLIHMVGKHLQLSEKQFGLLSQTVEFIHNASLLHDDLVDRSHLRRGKTSAWLRFTPEYAVLAGDYLLARVMVNLATYGNLQLVKHTGEVISDLLEGEWLQDSLVGDCNVELSQLDRVHNLKTASLFKLCLRSPFIIKEDYDPQLHTTLEEMGTLLGQLFQRSDDLLDFNIRNYENKALMGDLKSGYFNSFAAFACQGLSLSTRKAIKETPELSAFIDLVGGAEKFQERVDEFDRMNEGLIELYDHHVAHLLASQPESFVKQLRPLPDLLYWRRKNQ